MMVLLFALLLMTVILILQEKRNHAMYSFTATLLLGVLWFLHHANSALSIQL